MYAILTERESRELKYGNYVILNVYIMGEGFCDNIHTESIYSCPSSHSYKYNTYVYIRRCQTQFS